MQANGVCFLFKCYLVLKAELICKQYCNSICQCYKRAIKGREKLFSTVPSYKATEISGLQTKFVLASLTADNIQVPESSTYFSQMSELICCMCLYRQCVMYLIRKLSVFSLFSPQSPLRKSRLFFCKGSVLCISLLVLHIFKGHSAPYCAVILSFSCCCPLF